MIHSMDRSVVKNTMNFLSATNSRAKTTQYTSPIAFHTHSVKYRNSFG
jgi:hypothetical protein